MLRFIDGVGYVDIPDEKNDWYDVPSDEMTLEQARRAVKDLRKKLAEYMEQEPCGDCISRQAVLDIVDSYSESQSNVEDVTQDIISDIVALSPVNPQQKIGHWITEIKSDLRGDMGPTNPKCSRCGGEPYYSNTIYNYKFCPYCSAKMVEPQERSDKE